LRAWGLARSVVSATIRVSAVTRAADRRRSSVATGEASQCAGEVPAESLLGGVDVGRAAVGGAGDGGQVGMPAGHQPGEHVGEEVPPAGVGEWSGDARGERG
jgi:hypothetical protein